MLHCPVSCKVGGGEIPKGVFSTISDHRTLFTNKPCKFAEHGSSSSMLPPWLGEQVDKRLSHSCPSAASAKDLGCFSSVWQSQGKATESCQYVVVYVFVI